MSQPCRIAIVAGETSGDILGADLMRAMKKRNPELVFEGIGGERMIEEGFSSLFPMERLSVMGFAEVIKRLPELLGIRSKLRKHWLQSPPDVFIGIDAPDFNLALERSLHQHNIPVAHYVSPSVWAWREKRVDKIKGNLDLMLTLFPFEVEFYKKHAIPAVFVGHPLADEIPMDYSVNDFRQTLKLPENAQIIGVLPGSRGSELKYLAEPFIQACAILKQQFPQLIFILPTANQRMKQRFEDIKHSLKVDIDITLYDGHSHEVMAASDVLLMASGTAALEGMLFGKPMVVAGKTSALTMAIIRWFNWLKVKYVTLPNNLLNEGVVPELLQEDVTVDNIVAEVKRQLSLPSNELETMKTRFNEMHQQLRCDASATAAQLLHQRFGLDK